ncbi:MAG: hypothetical protein V7607_740 [Solirubrobacteraceae bacterium]
MTDRITPQTLRLALAFATAGAAVLATSGAVAAHAFTQPSSFKYAVSVGAPLLVFGLCVARQPLRAAVALVVVAAPFADLSAGVGPVQVPLLGALLLLACAAAVVTTRPPRALGPVGVAAVAGAVLLAPAVAHGARPASATLVVAAMVVTGWLVSVVAATPDGRRWVLGALLASMSLQAALAIYMFRTGNRLHLYGTAGQPTFSGDYFFTLEGTKRPTGAFSDPISLGNALGLALPLALAGAAGAFQRAAARLLAAGAGLLIAVALTLTLSRMSWIGAAAGLLVCLGALPAGRRAPSVIVMGVLVAVTLAAGSRIVGPELVQRAESALRPTASDSQSAESDRERVLLWKAALTTAEDHPIAGVGVNRINAQLQRRATGVHEATHAHSTYLQILAEAGLLGALALLSLIATLATAAIRGLRVDRMVAAGAAGGLVAVFVAWSTDYTIRYVPVAITMAVLFGLVAALGHREATG